VFAAGGGGGGFGEGSGDGGGASLGEGTGDGTAGLGDGLDAGVGEGFCVDEGVGLWVAGAAATVPCEGGDGVFVLWTGGDPAPMAATTIAIRAKGATNAETYARVATAIFHAVFDRYPGIFAYQGGAAAAAE